MTFGDDMNVKTIGVGEIGKHYEIYIHNVILVDNLGYNLLSVSQLCNRNLYVLFKKHECLVLDPNFNVIFKRRRYNDIDVVVLEKIDSSSFKCLKVTSDIL